MEDKKMPQFTNFGGKVMEDKQEKCYCPQCIVANTVMLDEVQYKDAILKFPERKSIAEILKWLQEVHSYFVSNFLNNLRKD